jgi:hypothetical protein
VSGYPIPDAALDDRLGFVGTAGSGKTYNASSGVERILASGGRVVIPDPLGVWWGLGLKADGNSPSTWRQAGKLVIFGGPHGDMPLNENAGALIGETVAGMAESAILDLSDLGTKRAEVHFMLAFLTALYRHASNEPVHLVFDEADMWAPQQERDKGESPKLLGMMETVVRRGRIKGFIPWLITQRPAVLNKNVLSQVDGLVAFKLTASQDRKPLGEWVKANAEEGEWPTIYAKLPTMQVGQALVWIPGRQILETAQFPLKLTFDSSRTPSRGERVEKRELKPLDLDKLKGRLASIEEEAKANDPTALKAEVARLKRELAKAEKVKAAPPQIVHANADEIAAAREAGRHQGISEGLSAAAQAVAALGGKPAKRKALPFAVDYEHGQAGSVAAKRPSSTSAPAPRPSTGNGRLPPGEQAVLIAAVQYGGVDRDQLSVLTGYKRSSRDAYIARLREKGLVEVAGQTVRPLDGAAEALGSDYQPLPEGEALQAYWMQRLPPGEAAILGELIGSYPNRLARTDLDERTGYKRSSRDAYIARLKARRLVQVSGSDIAAAETLFS